MRSIAASVAERGRGATEGSSRRRARTAYAVVLAVASVIATAPTPADAAKVSASPVEVRHALFSAGDVDRLSSGSSGTEALVLERLLQRMYALAPTLGSETAVATLRRLEAALPSRLPSPAALEEQAPNERILTILEALATPRPNGVAGRALAGLLRSALTESASGGGPGGEFTVSADGLGTLADGMFSPAATLADSAALADRAAAFARARDALWGVASGESAADTTSDLLAHDDALHNVQVKPLRDLIAPDGSLTTTTADLAKVQRTAVDAMSRSVSESIAAADSTASNADFRAASDARRSTLAGAVASTTLAAALVAARNQATATKAQTVARAVYTLGDAANRYAKTAKGIIPAGAFGSIGKAALAGNFALAAVSIAGAVLGGPSADELILAQLDALQNQIADFQAAVDRRFDALSAQVSGLKTQLDQVDVGLRVLRQRIADLQTAVTHVDADVRAVRDEVIQVQVSLDRIEADMYRIAEADRDRDLWQTINLTLGYRQRSAGGAALPGVELQRGEATLFTFATTTAADEVSEPAADRSFALDDLVAELDRVPLEGNLDFLRRFPFAAGLPGFTAPLAEDKVANARQWAVAARAYAELVAENLGRTTRSHLARLGRIADAGQKLEALVARLHEPDAATRTGSLLFDDLLDGYRAAFGLAPAPAPDSLLAALRGAERDYLAPLTGPAADVIYGEKPPLDSEIPLRFDPWGGPAQGGTIPHRIAHAPRCETGAGFDPARTLPVPNRYAYDEVFHEPNKTVHVKRGPFELPPEVRLARDLGLGQVRNCWRADYDPALRFPNGVAAGPQRILRVHLVWQWVPTGSSARTDIMAMSAESPVYEPVRQAPDPDDALFADGPPAQVGETVLQARVGHTTAWVSVDGDAVATVRAGVEAELRRHQIEIYKRVVAGIRGSGPLHDAAMRVTGLRRLLDAYIAVGLPEAADDDRLQALRLLDDDPPPPDAGPRAADRRISALYAAATDPAKTPPANLRVTLGGESARVDAFEAELGSIIGGSAGAATAGPDDGRETLPIVRSTLTRLAATEAVIRARLATRRSTPTALSG